MINFQFAIYYGKCARGAQISTKIHSAAILIRGNVSSPSVSLQLSSQLCHKIKRHIKMIMNNVINYYWISLLLLFGTLLGSMLSTSCIYPFARLLQSINCYLILYFYNSMINFNSSVTICYNP